MSSLKDSNPITDPGDFKESKLPQLVELDALLRCHICKEFMIAPMLTHCGHSFCSVCIRSYLFSTPKCPICAKELRESNLNRNILMEEVIISFKSLRPDLLSSLRPSNGSSSIHQTLPPKEVTHSNRKHSPTNCPSSPEIIEVDELNDGDVLERSQINQCDEDDVVILQEKETKKRFFDPKATGLDAFIKKPKTQETVSKQLGECPICFKKFPIQVLQSSHLDDCLVNGALEQPQKPNTPHEPKSLEHKVSSTKLQTSTILHQHLMSNSPIKPTFQKKNNSENTKLKKLDFVSLSTPAIKAKLSKIDLPVTGTRVQLEARYNQYLVLWNANCDSIIPKDPRILRRQLAQWESAVKMGTSTDSNTRPDWNSLIKKARETALNHKKSKEETINEKNHDKNAQTESPDTTDDEQMHNTTVIED